MDLPASLAGFVLSALVVGIAGVRLARHGDTIAARTRLGGVWVGAVFLAVATSLPELASNTAAVLLGEADLAAGGLFGANLTNMLSLAVLSTIPGSDLFRRAAIDNALGVALAITLTGSAAICVLVKADGVVLGVGIAPLLIAVGYAAGVRTLYRNSELARLALLVEETGGTAGDEPEAPVTIGAADPVLRRAVRGFVLAALLILVAAPLLAIAAEALAGATGLATSLVGTGFVALATTLPELVTSLAAVRMRAYDLAVGNLFGSNAFNMAIFLALDLAHPGSSIFATLSPVHALTGLVAVVLMGLGLAAIVYRAEGRLAALEPSSALMIVVYVLGIALVYAHAAR
jgi:cation:H+ antiporter